MEVWAIAKGYLDHNGQLEVTRENFEEFQRDLKIANNYCARFAKIVRDGAHRTRSKLGGD